MFFFGEVSSKPKCSAFSLKLPGEAANVLRTDVLDQLNSPSIIPHVAIQSGKQFPYEQIYRSNLHILIDTISAEYLFSTRWFRAGLLRKKSTWNEIKSALFKGTFDRSLQLFKDNVSTFLASCHDILGTLLMARITEHHRMVAERRGLKIPELDAFFGELNDMIWSKAFEIIDLNIKNLKSFRPASSSYEFRPHFVKAPPSHLTTTTINKSQSLFCFVFFLIYYLLGHTDHKTVR